MSRLRIENLRLLSEPAGRSQCIEITDGKISAVGTRPTAGFSPDRVLDAAGAFCLPGLVELSGFLREPGYEHKGSLRSELSAAVKGGVTSVCCPPLTLPVNDTAAVTGLIQERARHVGLARVFPIGALTQQLAGEKLSEMSALKEAGCIGVSNLDLPLASPLVTERCLEYARSQDMTVFVTPLDATLAAGGCVHEGSIGSRLGLGGIPETAETLAVSQWLMLAESTGAKLHLSALSCARSVELLREARARGLAVTCDVALSNLLFTDACIEDFDSRFHVRPPLRSETDRQALLQAVSDGVVDAICSRHEPHELAALQAPFAETEPGMSQFELWLSLLWRLSAEESLPFERLVEASSRGAARVAGIPGGAMQVGEPADLVLFDSEASQVVEPVDWLSSGRNTPWFGERLSGCVLMTLVDGRLVYDRETGVV